MPLRHAGPYAAAASPIGASAPAAGAIARFFLRRINPLFVLDPDQFDQGVIDHSELSIGSFNHAVIFLSLPRPPGRRMDVITRMRAER